MSRTSTESIKQKASKASSTAKKRAVQSSQLGDGADRYQMIATAAYFRAEQRGFMGGNPVDDWLAAEAEIGRLYH